MDSDDDIQIIRETTRKAKRRKTEPPRIVNITSDELFFQLPTSSSNCNYVNSQNACDKLKLLQTELEDFQNFVQEENKKSNGMIDAEFVQKRITLLLNILKPTEQEIQKLEYKVTKSQCENVKDSRIQFWFENTSFPPLRVNGPFERDVDIVCEGGAVIPVHSDILIACSSLFKELFQSGRQPQDTIILLPDHPIDLLTHVVDFIYTGSAAVPRNIINDVWCLLESLKILPNTNIAFGPSRSEEVDQVSITSTYLHQLSLNSSTITQPLPTTTTTNTTIETTITNTPPSPSSVPQDMEVDNIESSTESFNTNNNNNNNIGSCNYETEKMTTNDANNNDEVGDETLRTIEQQLEEMHSIGNTEENEQVVNCNNSKSNNIVSPSTSSACIPSPGQSGDDDQNVLEEEEDEEEEKEEEEEENSISHNDNSNSINTTPNNRGEEEINRREVSPSSSFVSVSTIGSRYKPAKPINPVKLHFLRGGRGSLNEAWRVQVDEHSIPSSPSSIASFCSKVTENQPSSAEDWPDLSSGDEHVLDDDDDYEPLSDSTEVLSSEEYQQPILCHYSPSDGWMLYQDRAQKYHAPVDNLSELTRHIDSLSECDPDLLTFPTHYFAFGAGDLAASDASKFFTKHGNLIKKLEIDLIPTQLFHSKMMKPDAIQRILTVHAPNVEYLEFLLPDSWRKAENCPSIFPDYDGKLKKATLENLISLKIDLGKFYPGYNNFLKEILAAAINLKNYGNENTFTAEGMNSQYLKTFIDLGKTRTIRDFDFEPSEKNIQHYEQFAQTFKSHKSHKHPDKSQQQSSSSSSSSSSSNQLRALGIDIRKQKQNSPLWFQVITILNILLRSNRNSLKVLILSGSICKIPFNQFPQLSNLKVLQVLIVKKEGILPKNFQLDKFFPNLSTIFLDLSFLKEKRMKLSHAFPDLKPVPSVKTIKILCTNVMSPKEIIQSLPSTFPNLEKLIVVNLYHFPSVAPIIWNNFEKLKYLDLTIIIYPRGCHSTTMDTIFTGLSKEEYVNVRKNIDELDEEKISELSRENPSIIKLKALKNLWVRFHGCFKESNENFPHFLTKVSKKLAFDLMPDLHVEFSIDQLTTDDRKINQLETSDDESYKKDKEDKLRVEKELMSLGKVNDGLNRPYGETAVQYLLSL